MAGALSENERKLINKRIILNIVIEETNETFRIDDYIYYYSVFLINFLKDFPFTEKNNTGVITESLTINGITSGDWKLLCDIIKLYHNNDRPEKTKNGALRQKLRRYDYGALFGLIKITDFLDIPIMHEAIIDTIAYMFDNLNSSPSPGLLDECSPFYAEYSSPDDMVLLQSLLAMHEMASTQESNFDSREFRVRVKINN